MWHWVISNKHHGLRDRSLFMTWGDRGQMKFCGNFFYGLLGQNLAPTWRFSKNFDAYYYTTQLMRCRVSGEKCFEGKISGPTLTVSIFFRCLLKKISMPTHFWPCSPPAINYDRSLKWFLRPWRIFSMTKGHRILILDSRKKSMNPMCFFCVSMY